MSSVKLRIKESIDPIYCDDWSTIDQVDRIDVESHGLTHRGLVRSRNEDSFLIADLRKMLRVRRSSLMEPTTRLSDDGGCLFIVADGMGGHRAGQYASALAVKTIEDFVLNTQQWFLDVQGPEEHNVLGKFQTAMRLADTRVCEAALERPDLRGMGTTLTLAYVRGNSLYVVHAGDSRAYLVRGGKMHQLTHDDTLVGELRRRGILAPEDAGSPLLRHIITNSIGGGDKGVSVEAHMVDLEPEDRLLLCSDGLTQMVPDETIKQLLDKAHNPKLAAESLLAEALKSGGSDNVTVIVAHFSRDCDTPCEREGVSRSTDAYPDMHNPSNQEEHMP